jgi:ABC-type branched-subunit amino acid transport system substrate-binding protein
MPPLTSRIRARRTAVGWVIALTSFAAAACGSTVDLRDQRANRSLDLGVADRTGLTPEQQAADGSQGVGLDSPGRAGGAVGAEGGAAREGRRGSPGSGPSAPSAREGSGGSRAVRTPIALGLLVFGSNEDAAAQLGADVGATVTMKDAANGLVDYFNRMGGLAGRRILKVEYVMEASASDTYESQAQAACATFTQDHHVAAVVSAHHFFSPTLQTCLAKSAVPYIGASSSTDMDGYRTYPGLATPSVPSVDRRILALVDGRARDGYLSKKNRLGVIVDSCAYNLRAYSRTLVPAAARHGIQLERADIECITGFGDAGPSSAAMQSAILRFRNAGVDRVMFLSNFEASLILIFAQQAETAQYRPGYLVSSGAGLATVAGNYPRAQLVNMHGTGWGPTLDVTAQDVRSPATRRCRAALASVGIRSVSKADDVVVDLSCDSFFLLEAILKATKGSLSHRLFRSTLAGLGASYRSPINLGTTTFSATKHDGPETFSAFGYQSECGCFRYTGSPFRLR